MKSYIQKKPQSSHLCPVLLAAVLFLSGCTSEKPLTEITIPGHGSQVYVFSYDIRESSKVPAQNENGIRDIFLKNDEISIVFDGSSETDNAYFRVVVINIIEKLRTYFAYEGKLMKFTPYYFIGDGWYDATGEIDKPNLTNIVWLVGPATGAKETSLVLESTIVYLQGTSYKNLTLAGDKLALIIMEVEV